MLPVIIQACDRAIEDGISVEGDWVEVGWSDGGADWARSEVQTLSETAQDLIRIRKDVRVVLDLVERIDDLIAAQRDISELRL